MEFITFRCGSCQHGMKVTADKAGRKVKCTKCGKPVTIPQAGAATQAAPVAAQAAAKTAGAKPGDDEVASYSFIQEAAPPESDEKKKEEPKKEEKKPKIRRKIRKKKVQDADDWLKFRFALVLVFLGGCGWLAVWLLHTGVVTLGLLSNAAYGSLVDRASEGGEVSFTSLVAGILAGGEHAGAGQVALILEQVIDLAARGLCLFAYFICLGVPNRFGTRLEATVLVVLGILNTVLGIVLKLLPALGVGTLAWFPLLAPEAALNEANVARLSPIHVFWCASPFWETFGSVLIFTLYFLEPLVFCMFLRAAAMAMKDDEWIEPRAVLLLRLGFGQLFILIAYVLLSLTGTSSVLQTLLFAAYWLWRGFLLGFLISFAQVMFKAKARVEYLLTEDED